MVIIFSRFKGFLTVSGSYVGQILMKLGGMEVLLEEKRLLQSMSFIFHYSTELFGNKTMGFFDNNSP